MRRLRAECPWDRGQTHESLRPYLLEETYEVLHLLDERRYQELREELGDLMLQVVFHAEIAQENGRFDVADVIYEISEKLIRRHPHVFGQQEAADAADVLRRWEAIKTGEEKKRSVLAGVPATLPALLQAMRVLSKIRQTGVSPWRNADPIAAVRAWTDQLEAAAAQGDREGLMQAAGMLAFSVAAGLGKAHANPEDALRTTVRRLVAAFRDEESRLRAEGRDFSDLSDEERNHIARKLLETCRESPQ